MRYAPPITTIPREAMNPVTVGDYHFDTGAIVVVEICGTNRDPKQFDDPNSFNVFRERKPHFSFGGGEHLCAGIWVSRMATVTAWKTLYERIPSLRVIDPENTGWFGFTYRGIQNLPVTWDVAEIA